MKSQQAMQPEVTEFDILRQAVKELYYAAVWTADRPVNATELWTAVRDAAGFKPGNSPKELPYDGIQVSYPTDRLRQIGALVSKHTQTGRNFGTPETRAFLLLHGQELVDKLDKTVREFLQEKLS